MEVIVSLTLEEVGLIVRGLTYYHPRENCDGVVAKLFRAAKPYLIAEAGQELVDVMDQVFEHLSPTQEE